MHRPLFAALGLILGAGAALAQAPAEPPAPVPGQPVPPNMEGQPLVKPGPRIGDHLVGTRWQAASILGRPPLKGSLVTLEFLRGSQLRGGAGCNRYVGPWATRADKAAFGPLRKSRLRCSATLEAQEDRYLRALDAGERMELQDEEQVLLIYPLEEKQPLRFTRLP